MNESVGARRGAAKIARIAAVGVSSAVGLTDEGEMLTFRGNHLPEPHSVVRIYIFAPPGSKASLQVEHFEPLEEFRFFQDHTVPIPQVEGMVGHVVAEKVRDEDVIAVGGKVFEGIGRFIPVNVDTSALADYYFFEAPQLEKEWLLCRLVEGGEATTYNGKPLKISSATLETLTNGLMKILPKQLMELQLTLEEVQKAQQELEAEKQSHAEHLERERLTHIAELDKASEGLHKVKEESEQISSRLDSAKRALIELDREKGQKETEVQRVSDEIVQKTGQLSYLEEHLQRYFQKHEAEDDGIPAIRALPPITEESRAIELAVEALSGRAAREDVVMLHLALKLSPFVVLAGPSGAGKSSLLRCYAQALGIHFTLFPVQPNWTSVADLHGYIYPLKPRRFIPTPFSQALGCQLEGENFLSLVLLDEINLSHVEYFLADYLSAFESKGRMIRIANSDEISDATVPDWLKENCGRVSIPTSFLIAGTANEDHTTRAFSDKFRDRAAVIQVDAARPKLQEVVEAREEKGKGRITREAWLDWRKDPVREAPKKERSDAFKRADRVIASFQEAKLPVSYRTVRDLRLFLTHGLPLLADLKVTRREQVMVDRAVAARVVQKYAALPSASFPPERRQDLGDKLRDEGLKRSAELLENSLQ
jgi:energy-coupling factor transporter ATP-binding protein EcfA2